jgi:linoleate 9S-lipoxygenase
LGAGESAFNIHFEWDDEMGIPGAFYIKNYMQVEFYLKSLTLEDVPNHGTIRFVCNSWVYNAKLYKSPRIFFANKVLYIYLFSVYLVLRWICQNHRELW